MSWKSPTFPAGLPALLMGGALFSQPAVSASPPSPAPPTSFAQERQMGFGALMHRWDPLITEASRRFGVPEKWIRIVMQVESGGRTLTGEKLPIVSRAGA